MTLKHQKCTHRRVVFSPKQPCPTVLNTLESVLTSGYRHSISGRHIYQIWVRTCSSWEYHIASITFSFAFISLTPSVWFTPWMRTHSVITLQNNLGCLNSLQGRRIRRWLTFKSAYYNVHALLGHIKHFKQLKHACWSWEISEHKILFTNPFNLWNLLCREYSDPAFKFSFFFSNVLISTNDHFSQAKLDKPYACMESNFRRDMPSVCS